MKCLIAIIMVFAFLALPVGAEIYSWTDKNGVKHFSNEPPPGGETAEQQEEVKHDAGQYEKWNEARQSKQEKMLEEGRSETHSAKKTTPPVAKVTKRPGNVVMYTTPTCGYCKRARSFFGKYHIAYTDYDITTDKQARKQYKELKGSGVPLILVGDRRLPGFNEKLLRNLFGIN